MTITQARALRPNTTIHCVHNGKVLDEGRVVAISKSGIRVEWSHGSPSFYGWNASYMFHKLVEV